MISEAYVWCWLPGEVSPVVAGRIVRNARSGNHDFVYGRSYLNRSNAVSLFTPELPLVPGAQEPQEGLRLPSVLRDGAPDFWGRRVILDQVLGHRGADAEVDKLDELTYMLYSGSDRIGALDFQRSAVDYVPRGGNGSLPELLQAAELLEAGQRLPDNLSLALVNGTSIGGARPKALITEEGTPGWVAKFSSATDIRPVVRQEAASLALARYAGINVPASKVIRSMGKDVLLVQRFDRPGDGTRRMMVSGLTILQLDEMMARYATYPELVDRLQVLSAQPELVGPEIFERIAFNMTVSNTDDHARNHAAFWDGRVLELTPAYDLDPQFRRGETAAQAMAYGADGERASNLALLLKSAGRYGLTPAEARERIDRIVQTIHDRFHDAAEEGKLTTHQRDAMWKVQILNPACLYDY